MTNSFRAKSDSIMEVVSVSVMSLTTMEEAWHLAVIDGNFVFIRNNLFTECGNLWGEIFFVDHVEPGNQFCKSFIFCASSLFDVSKHFGDV